MSEFQFRQLSLGITRRPRKDPLQLTEHELMNWTISYLGMKGHFVQRINAGQAQRKDFKTGKNYWIKMAQKGTPDICGHHGQTGKAIYVEVKVRPNKPEPAQLEFINNAKACGCIAEIVYSQDDVMNIEGI